MNKYNPDIHHRKSIRLVGYDYSQVGLYFITICCEDRICRFGYIEDGKMTLNIYGKIAYDEWTKLPERFPNIELDVFQVMPNHIHGIIVITVGATLAVAQNDSVAPNDIGAQNDIDAQNDMVAQNGTGIQNDSGIDNNRARVNRDNGARVNRAPTIGNVIGAYKSLVTHGCLEIYKSKNEMMGKLWQRNYWEHIIRNDISYRRISEYIINNPVKWIDDKFNPDQNNYL